MPFKMLAKAITPLPAAKDEVVDGQVVRHAALTDPEDALPPALCRPGGQPRGARDLPRAPPLIHALRDFLD